MQRVGLGGGGRCACHTQTPDNQRFDVPAIDDDTTWAEALTWTVAASLVSGIAGLVARRAASETVAGNKPAGTFR